MTASQIIALEAKIAFVRQMEKTREREETERENRVIHDAQHGFDELALGYRVNR